MISRSMTLDYMGSSENYGGKSVSFKVSRFLTKISARFTDAQRWMYGLPKGKRAIVIGCGAGGAVPGDDWTKVNQLLSEQSLKEPKAFIDSFSKANYGPQDAHDLLKEIVTILEHPWLTRFNEKAMNLLPGVLEKGLTKNRILEFYRGLPLPYLTEMGAISRARAEKNNIPVIDRAGVQALVDQNRELNQRPDRAARAYHRLLESLPDYLGYLSRHNAEALRTGLDLKEYINRQYWHTYPFDDHTAAAAWQLLLGAWYGNT